MFKDEGGNWVSNQDLLRTMVSNYFKSLYSGRDTHPLPYRAKGSILGISDALMHNLAANVTKEEVRSALFDMAPLKAPCIDGLQALFFQSQWDIVGDSLFTEVSVVFDGNPLCPTFNRRLITLIPKIDQPKHLKEFRPISLCTTVYKLVTKIIAARLKHIMPSIISPYQSSFVQGRNIIDNIIIG